GAPSPAVHRFIPAFIYRRMSGKGTPVGRRAELACNFPAIGGKGTPVRGGDRGQSDGGHGRAPMGSRGRGPPGAFDQCSTCQPRRRAMVASFGSGFTATGKPTDSSIGRSEAESA